MDGFVVFMIHTIFHPMKKRAEAIIFSELFLFKAQTCLLSLPTSEGFNVEYLS
jgi:hypothetical protein